MPVSRWIMRVLTAMLGAVLAGVVAACSGAGSTGPPAATSPPDTGSVAPTAGPSATPTSAAAEAAAPPRAGPEPLLPDMISLPAADIHIELDGEVRLLRFEATLANIGVGPVEIFPDDGRPCPAEQRFASQRVYLDGNDDGVYTPEVDTDHEIVPAGCMVDHPTHDHWHFDSSARYVVTAPGDPAPIVHSDKVSFCLRDTIALYDGAGAPTYGDCRYDSTQGITAGWGDVYTSELDGQHLALPADLPDGRYCLMLSANPYHLLRESDGTNNGSRMGVQITGATATAAAPSGCVPPPALPPQ